MRRPPVLALACLTILLLPLPMVLAKPGWPTGLKADEPAYWLMASSLAYDFDLELGEADRRRAFDSFPFGPMGNVVVMSDDGWETLYYGKPYVYSLLSVPWVWVFGPNGPLVLNMVLYLGCIWLGFRYLARHNPEWVAALTSGGFFLVSVGFAYVFWIQPEVLNMASVTVALYLGLVSPHRPGGSRWRAWLADPSLRAALAGAALVPAVYNKPMLALLGLPVLLRLGLQRKWWQGVSWAAGVAVALAFLTGVFWYLTGLPSPYLGAARGGYELCSPHEAPVSPAPPPPQLGAAAPEEEGIVDGPAAAGFQVESRPQGSWGWIFHVPDLDPRELAERFSYFLWGRHTGLFLYFPFTLMALGLFLAYQRRSLVRWGLLASIVGVALVFLLWITDNWHGGGGFVGNRYFVNAYPAFLFLVTRVAPIWLPVAGYALGGLLLAPTLFSPFGRAVPWPTLQAHVRNAPFSLFPLELSLKGVPGYESRDWGGLQVRGRRDLFLPQGGRFWVHGATTTELWLQSPEPLEGLAFDVRSHAAPNRVTFRLGRERTEAEFASDQVDATQRVELAALRPTKVRRVRGHRVYAYRLEIAAATGEVRHWTRHMPPQTCDYFPYLESWDEPFYVGAELLLIADPEILERELYDVIWEQVSAPDEVVAGRRFAVPVRARNASQSEWPATPPIHVQLSYHWETLDGEVHLWDGVRTPLPAPLPPGGLFTGDIVVDAPAEPGDYHLVLDLLLEDVAWFSWRGAPVHRVPVRVVPAEAAERDPL